MAERVVCSRVDEGQWRAAHERWGSVYFILDAKNDRVKIGHSRDPWARLKALQTGSSSKLSLVAVIAGSRAVEQKLHIEQRGMHVHLEWFSDGAAAVEALNKRTQGAPMCRFVARLVQAHTVDVWWEWSAERRIHFKHVYDHGQKRWVGPLMYSGRPNARPGWDATLREIAAE